MMGYLLLYSSFEGFHILLSLRLAGLAMEKVGYGEWLYCEPIEGSTNLKVLYILPSFSGTCGWNYSVLYIGVSVFD
jgi:hypothetical protein